MVYGGCLISASDAELDYLRIEARIPAGSITIVEERHPSLHLFFHDNSMQVLIEPHRSDVRTGSDFLLVNSDCGYVAGFVEGATAERNAIGADE
jgi:hypothetical protein